MYKKIVSLTFLPVFENKMVLIKALLIPLLVIVGLNIISKLYPENWPIHIFTIIVTLTVNIVIAITTHRILLLGKESVPKWGHFAVGKREFSFFIASILIGIVCIPILLLALIPYAGIFIAVIGMLIVFSRLSLMFPSIAIDKPLGMQEAWDFTKEYKLLTLFTIIIFPTIFTAIVGIVYTLVIKFLMGVVSEHLFVLFALLDVFMTVFVVSALSATYRVINEEHPEYFEIKKDKEVNQNEIVITSNGEEFIVNTQDFPLNFESIKAELIRQYENLGFNNIVVDKEDSWMAKNPENTNAYIALSTNTNGYTIEAYNVQEADLNEGMKREIND